MKLKERFGHINMQVIGLFNIYHICTAAVTHGKCKIFVNIE